MSPQAIADICEEEIRRFKSALAQARAVNGHFAHNKSKFARKLIQQETKLLVRASNRLFEAASKLQKEVGHTT